MGKLTGGIFGAATGKVGGVVGSTWKGFNTVRTYRATIANPRTTAQVNQRTKMTEATKLGSTILSQIVKPLWDRFAKKQSGYNAFVAANIANFDILSMEWDLASMIFSRGKMSAVQGLGFGGSGTSFIFDWSPALSDQYQQSSDIAYGVVMSVEGNVKFAGSLGAIRSAGSIGVTLSSAVTSTDWCYLSFIRNDGTIVSDSAGTVCV